MLEQARLNNMEELANFVGDHDPEIITPSETKLRNLAARQELRK